MARSRDFGMLFPTTLWNFTHKNKDTSRNGGFSGQILGTGTLNGIDD